MPCVEYHLVVVLICLVKNGISLDLGKNWVGFFNNTFFRFLNAFSISVASGNSSTSLYCLYI